MHSASMSSADSLHGTTTFNVSNLTSASMNSQSHVEQGRSLEIASSFVPANLENGVSANHLAHAQYSSPSLSSVMELSEGLNTAQNLVSGTQMVSPHIVAPSSSMASYASYSSKDLSRGVQQQ